MLQWLRDNLKSFAWTLWLVIIAFILLYVPDFLNQQRLSEGVAAVVGEQEVTEDEFLRAYSARADEVQRALGEQFTPELAQQLQLWRQVLDGLVAQKILLAEARRLGLSVADEELRREILSFPTFQENGRFVGDERYAVMVSRMRYSSVAEFEREVRQSLLLGKVQSVLGSNLYIPDGEVERAYRQQAESARIRYLNLPVAELAGEVEIADQELASFYAAHREEYRRPEQRTADYLLVDKNRLRGQIQIPAEDLRAYYEANQEEFTQEEQVRARHILLTVDEERSREAAEAELGEARRRIEAGEDFAAVAREISDDPGSKEQGGDLGYFARGRMLPAFEEAAFAARAGELVGPVETSFGLHLLEVLDHRQGGVRPFAEAEAQIRFRLQGERAEVQAESRAGELARRIEAEGLTSREALEELAEGDEAVIFATTEPFGQQDPVPGLGYAPAFAEAAFSLAEGGVSDAVEVPRGWVILRLASIVAPRVPELAEVEDQVRRELREEKQKELALERLQEARQRLDAGEEMEVLAEELGLAVRESGEVRSGQPIEGLGIQPAVTRAALAMSEGEVGGPVEAGQGAVVFQVTERKRWDPAEFESAREETRRRLESEELQRVLGALIQKRRIELGVRYSPRILEEFGEQGAPA